MAKYAGVKCPVCAKRFAPPDDVVVCPACGAPHHRHCYLEAGQCAFSGDHISGKEWKPDPPEFYEDGQSGDGEGTKPCPFCSSLNPRQAIFCQICCKLIGAATPHTPYPAPNFRGAYGAPVADGYKDETISGLDVSHIASYVGPNSSYYIPRFYAIDKLKANATFSLCAFLFGFLYFFYRKMYLVGAGLFIIFILLRIPSFLYLKEIYPDMLFRYGMGPEPSLNNTAIELYTRIGSFANVIAMAVSFASGFFANRLYYNKVVREVSEISCSPGGLQDGEDAVPLAARGGININIVVIVIAVVGAILLISNMIALGISV